MQRLLNPCLIASTTCERLSKHASHVQGPGTSAAQSEELRVAAARLLAAQAMVQEGSMAAAARRGAVAGWPSPSNSNDDAAVSTQVKKVRIQLWKPTVCLMPPALGCHAFASLRAESMFLSCTMLHPAPYCIFAVITGCDLWE